MSDRGPGYDISRGDWQTTKLFHVTTGMIADSASAIADWGERNMGDKQTLIDFVSWSKTNYPADHYELYFWGHGWNWHPGYVMEDDTDADTLDLDELKAALPSLGFIDVVGYDGCNMASIEVFTPGTDTPLLFPVRRNMSAGMESNMMSCSRSWQPSRT